MPAMSRGAMAKPAAKPRSSRRAPKRTKGGTESTKNHTFKGFSQRIAQIKIEPVRRGRSTILDDAELESTFSYFRDALLEWRELNLSDAFSVFARRVAALSDSLPQVVHHSARIMELLVEYMDKGDKYAQEPLLSLMAHLAHDLGERFETHFETAVTTVARLAATHSDVEVIEWSFGCLAWLFKYLSRLLVPDLRPVFDLMSPLLGRERQKAFVSRFAAESLSFLIRKAGAGYHRDKKPLKLITKHISDQMRDVQGTSKDFEFQHGLMYLLTDSLKGVQHGFHSSAPAILQELLAETYSEEHAALPNPSLEPILIGVLTAAIHHTDAENFKPLLDVLLAHIESASPGRVRLSSRLLFVACGVRQGTRVVEWKPVFRCLELLVKSTQTAGEPDSTTAWDLLSAVSVIFQYSSLDAAIPHEKLLEELSHGLWEKYFLSFSILFDEFGGDKFKALLLPYFKRFIAQKAHDHGPELSFILPQLYERGTVSSGALQSSEKWQALLNDPFDHIAKSDATSEDLTKVYYCNALLNTTGVLAVNDLNTRRILGDLERLLRRALATTDTPRQIDHFAVGVGLQFFVEKSSDHDLLTELWPALCQAASYYGRSLSFWRALLVVSKRDKARLSLEGSHMDILRRSLIRCLSSPSHDLRLTAIYIIVELVASKSEEVRHIISVAMLIEQTPLTLEHQRSIGMRVGQLAKLYPSISSDDWMGEAIPTFCFGLLHYRLASVWDNSCSALKVMCNVKEGEGYVTRLAVEWLAATESDDSIGIADASTNTPPRPYVNEFECTNIVELEERVSTIATQAENVEDQLDAMFKRQHEQLPLINLFSRTQALKLLNTLPQIAEKRNASLVPILLSWALDEPFAPLQDDNEEDFPIENAGPGSQSRWNRKDQKEMLALFAKFVNPKVLFRSDDVREALLALLSNGDIEIQKAALQALLAWKNSAVSAYKDELLGLLDDARFREELPAFLGEGKIQIDHVDSVLPLVLRLLYGRVIAGKRGLESKRKSVFVGLMNRFGDAAIHQFLAIAFGRLKGISVLDDEDVLSIKVDARKQVGLLNMLESLSSTLEASFAPFVETSIDPILYCVIKASRDVASSTATEPSQGEASDGPRLKIAMLRSIRQRGIQLLSRLVENSPEFGWQAYTDVIVTELIEPRLELLPIESAQSVSAFLRLFAAWSKSSHTAPFLVEKNILAKIIDCLEVPSAKDEVKKFVLDDILRNLVLLVGDSDIDSQTTLRSKLIEPYSHAILSSVGNVLRQSPSKEVLESGVLMVADLAPHVVGSTNSRSMIEISTFLLRQPSKRVNSHTKLGLLKILHAFIQQYEDVPELFDNIFDAICPTFAFVQDRIARSLLCQIIDDLSKSREELVEIAVLCRDLNSFSSSRLDEPDFERRSLAYNKINSEGYQRFTLTQFKPLVWSMLHFIKDNDELSIRTSASLSLRRFIEVSASSASEFRDFIAASILPGIEHGMREPSELVRTEYLAVLEQLVKVHSDWALLADLHVLTGSADSEGEDSFFGNVLHIQSHRRLRALRRLATHASQIGSRNIYHIILPLLEQFVFQKADDESADGLSGETIKTLTSLCECLEWPQLRALTKRYIGYLTVDGKQDLQKQTIKLIGGLMDGLNRAAKAKGYVTVAPTTKQDVDLEAQVNGGTDAMDVDTPVSSLTKTLPQQEKLTKDVIDNLLPKLVEFLHKKDDTTVSLRVPVAVAIVKVLMVLPPAEIEARLPAILLDIAYILKSRAQESRDMARNTLSEIVLFMGASYLGFVLKSLRTALQRGYQLHVLSFVLHAILVKLQPQPGDLDYCLAEIVDVVMDDTFGITGQEKDAEEYVSTMKEVKSSKSFDSMDIVARSATPSHLIKLIIPIKSLLLERLNSKMVQKIDELLRRIGLGLLQNPTMHSRDVLVFCYEMIQEVYMASATSEKKSKVDPKSRRYLITMRGAAKSGARLSTATYTFKLIRFSLDILRTVLRQNTELQTPQNLAGFLPIIGDAMVQGQEEVQVSAMRLLQTIIKSPLPALDESCPVYVDEAIRAIKGAPSSNTELAQASLKLVAAVLRERPNVEIKDRDIGHLIKRIMPDLDEPDKQGVSFGFLKAVMQRGLDIPEIYEAMDKTAEISITNHTQSIRNVARSHYFQFLTSYTQSEKRFKKQMEFLLKNLRYDHVEGRQSVMEALDLVITKALPRFSDKLQYEYHGMMFLPMVNTLANDDNAKCRELASLLVKNLFRYSSEKRLQAFAIDLKQWMEQDDNAGLRRLGIQCFGFYFETMDEDEPAKEVAWVLEQLDSVIDECLSRRGEDDWELLYYALTLFAKMCKSFPDTMFSANRDGLWTAVEASSTYPHAWVKMKAAELLGTLFAHLGITNKDTGLEALPLVGSGGLQLAEQNMLQLTHAMFKNLLNQEVTEQLCMQSVKNLAFLARCFAVNGARWNWQRAGDDDEQEGDETATKANGDAAASDDEFGGCSPPPETASMKPAITTPPPLAIHRLMIRLSGIVRRDNRSMHTKLSSISLLETIAAKFPLPPLSTSLPHLLTTLNTLVDPATTIPRAHTHSTSLNEPNEQYKSLIDKAREIMSILQKRMGTQAYLDVMSGVQQGIRERRDERRMKRRLDAVADPEKSIKMKKRKHDHMKVKRRERGAEHREMRKGH